MENACHTFARTTHGQFDQNLKKRRKTNLFEWITIWTQSVFPESTTNWQYFDPMYFIQKQMIKWNIYEKYSRSGLCRSLLSWWFCLNEIFLHVKIHRSTRTTRIMYNRPLRDPARCRQLCALFPCKILINWKTNSLFLSLSIYLMLSRNVFCKNWRSFKGSRDQGLNARRTRFVCRFRFNFHSHIESVYIYVYCPTKNVCMMKSERNISPWQCLHKYFTRMLNHFW